MHIFWAALTIAWALAGILGFWAELGTWPDITCLIMLIVCIFMFAITLEDHQSRNRKH